MSYKVLILGIGGQDGSYLADILLDQGCEVHGLYRRSSIDNLTRIAHIKNQLTLHSGDILDPTSVAQILSSVSPREVYNVADQDHVPSSLTTPGYSFDVTAKAVATTLESIRLIDKSIKFFQPCSATMFGNAPPKQNEDTSHNPQSPYACAKTAAYHVARYYRQAYGMFVGTAILYNHDSPRRGKGYLLSQICKSVRTAVSSGTPIVVGDPNMIVDIGFAEDYMRAAVTIMRQSHPDDFVIASGHPMTIGQVIETAMQLFGTTLYSIETDPKLLRPGKQPELVGDISKASEVLGFSPSTNMKDLLTQLL